MKSLSARMAKLDCCKKEREKLKQRLFELLSIKHPNRKEVEEVGRIKKRRAQLKSHIQVVETTFGLAT